MHYVVLADFSPLWGEDPGSVDCILERLTEDLCSPEELRRELCVFVPVVHVREDGTETRTRFGTRTEAENALERWKGQIGTPLRAMYHNPRVVTRTTP